MEKFSILSLKILRFLKDFYLRIFAPIFIALSSIVVLGLFLSYYSLTLALLTVFLLVLGCVVPILTHYYNKNNDDNLAVAQAGFNIKVFEYYCWVSGD